MNIREWALRTLGALTAIEYEKTIKELTVLNDEKDSHINTLESMMEDIQKSHIREMKGINTKLDFLGGAYKKQNLELQAMTKELLWQREQVLGQKEEADVWRKRLETKMELDNQGPADLAKIERKIDDDKKRSKKA
jgi:hypothetical protein